MNIKNGFHKKLTVKTLITEVKDPKYCDTIVKRTGNPDSYPVLLRKGITITSETGNLKRIKYGKKSKLRNKKSKANTKR